MKKFVVLLFSISLFALFATTKDVKVSTSYDVAISTEDNVLNHPIQPPIG